MIKRVSLNSQRDVFQSLMDSRDLELSIRGRPAWAFETPTRDDSHWAGSFIWFSSGNRFCKEILVQVSKPLPRGGNDTILSNELYSIFQLWVPLAASSLCTKSSVILDILWHVRSRVVKVVQEVYITCWSPCTLGTWELAEKPVTEVASTSSRINVLHQ